MEKLVMELISEIHKLSLSQEVSYQKLALLWQKLYLYEKEHPDAIIDRDCLTRLKDYFSRNEFWKMHDNAKTCPIYYQEKQYSLDLSALETVSDQDFSSEKEKLEYHIKQAIRYAMRELSLKSGKDMSSSSLYHYCRHCSFKVADYLENEDYEARVISLQDCFSPRVGHYVCWVKLNQKCSYIVDMTYRQFFLLATCMEEATFHKDEPYIAPGYFVDTDEKQEMLASLLSQGYFECSGDVLRIYADTFVLAEQSIDCGPKLTFTYPKKTASKYLQAVKDAPRSKY